MQALNKFKDAVMGSGHEEQPSTHTGSAHYQNVSSTSTHGEVVCERPVAVGVAEFPVMVTEQERISTDMSTHQQREEVCGQKAFTEVEGRPVVRERVERIMEHRPVEKQYVVEIRFVGERELGTSHTEIVDVKKCVVEVAQPGPTCPASTGAVMNEVVNSITRRV